MPKGKQFGKNVSHCLDNTIVHKEYIQILEALTMLCNYYGYACMVHGSMQRDLDIVLFAFDYGAITPEDMIEKVTKCLQVEPKKSTPTEMAFNRATWMYYLHDGIVVDLSIIRHKR